jgi:alpha-L-rhamnosidase
VTVAVGPTPGERVSTALSVAFDNPPTTVHDHIDLGDAVSERDHDLTASPASGTNVEAGPTRRYTNTTVPGGWLEFELRVPEGKPFVLRSVETYDQAQLKTYDILVDGQRVHERAYQRTDGGAETLTHQFVVDEPELTEDRVVRVRFQDVDGGYGPSIADVWAIPSAGAEGGSRTF